MSAASQRSWRPRRRSTQGFREASARCISHAFAASSMMAEAVMSSSNAATLMARTTAGSMEIRNWRFSPDGGRLPFREAFFIVIPRGSDPALTRPGARENSKSPGNPRGAQLIYIFVYVSIDCHCLFCLCSFVE